MITLHHPDLQPGTTFTTSGRMVLDPHLASAQVSEEINGAFTLHLSWPLGALGMVAEGDIVAAPIPGIARQGFRITTLEATSDQLMTATCTHITSDLGSNVIVDKAAVNRTASEALAYLLAPIPAVGLKGIWWAVPIGWVLADLAGLVLWRRGESGGEAGPHAKCQSAERL